MSVFSFDRMAIRAISAAVPAHVKKFDQSSRKVERFVQQIGIAQVHISLTEQTTVDLGYVALQQALAKAGWQATDLDLLIFDSQTPDYLGGVGNSSLLHHYMHLREDCAVFDVTVGCPAFPYTLAIAGSMMQCQPTLKRVAIVMGDNQWCYFAKAEDITKKSTLLVGEGTGVLLLEQVPPEETNPVKVQLFSKGDGYSCLSFHFGTKNAWRRGDCYEMPDGGIMDLKGASNGTYMNGSAVSDFATITVKNSIQEHYGTGEEFGKSFDYFVFHQANQQILNQLGDSLHLPREKVLSSLARYGNTYCATAIITMCDQLSQLQRPAHIFNASYGVGLSWGFSEFVVPENVICQIVSTEHRFDEHFLKPIEI